ncbi:unnamed protein product [Lymnaea stagnalis]|uniref:Uncharacterized protein n=1 Tax=Lymnaea stagnalis TaxID=6523 RepID=A0AAV2I570_LYMST
MITEQITRWELTFLLVAVSWGLTKAQDGSAPVILDITNNQLIVSSYVEVERGFLVYLSIKASGSGVLRYVWTQNDIVVRNSTENTPLSFPKADFNVSGVYRCIVSNVFGTVRSLPITLVVKELGQFPADSNKTINIEEGKFVLLQLPNISYIARDNIFTITWQSGFPENYRYVSLNYDLAVLNIQRSNNGSQFNVILDHSTSNTILRTYSSYYILNVSASSTQNPGPEFVIKPKDTTVRTNENAKFECVINAQPFSNLQINWYFVNDTSKQLISGSKYTLSNNNRTLTISAVTQENAGTYECQGSLGGSPFSPITFRATLTVIASPIITTTPNDAVIKKDFQEPFSITCTALGFPKPDLNWYFNGKKLVDLNSTRFHNFDNGTLYIASVDLPDSGVYQCVGVNIAGEGSAASQVIVNSAPPTMIEAPKNKTVAEFEDTGFTCKVKGGPQPEVYWTKDNVNLTIGGRIRVTSEQLLIGQAVLPDSGLYTCVAVNIKGSVASSAALAVIVKTQIIKPPQNISKPLGTDALLDCGVKSDPSITPTWSWSLYKDWNKQNITGTGRFQIFPNGSLLIIGLIGADTGRYECVVRSIGGNDNRTANLSVIATPEAPRITNVNLYPQLPNSVVVNWTLSYDGDTPIIKFVILNRQESFSGSGTDNPWNIVNSNVSPNLQAIVISGLLPSRYYRFKMTAVNKVGESMSSNIAPDEAIKMPAQPPSEAPKNLFCRQGQEQEIVVQWDPPSDSSWNGELFGYLIYYKVDAFSDETEKAYNISGKDVRLVTITNLVYNRKYRVRITAYNERGPGVNSTDFYVTTLQGKPTAPPQNVNLSSPNSTTVRAMWDPPPNIELNGINQGYEIEVKEGGILKRTEIVRFDESNPTGRQSYDIVNLSKYTLYEIRIACRTAPGAGPQSSSLSIRTLEDYPGPVSDLKIDSIRNKTLRITWLPPIEINGILTGYIIKYQQKTGTSPVPPPIERTPETTSHTLTDLLYETTYVISVQAKTVVGPGPARTTEINSGVPPELPGPPKSLAVTNIEARSVLLQFIPGYDGKTTITLWIVEAQTENNSSWVRIYSISDETANQILVKNLLPYTRYKLRIIAQNIVDNSEPSEPCNQFQTKQAAPGVAPEDVTPRAINSTAIRVRWRQIPRNEWNGDSLGYRIRYRRWSKDVNLNTTSPEDIALVREPTWRTVDISNGSITQEYILGNLEEWMDYQIEIVSYNVVGSSSPSLTMSERTEEDVPSASPGNILLFTKSSTSIMVSWTQLPILLQNGNIRGYKVRYKARWPGAEMNVLQVDGESTLNVTLTSLRKFVEYEVQVQAFSRMGDGVLSQKAVKRTAGDVPGPPVIIYFPLVTDNSATIVWQEPEEPNGVIINYRVAYKQGDQLDSAFDNSTVDKPPNVFEYTVTGLVREMYYIFGVTARTQDGWGETAKVDVYIIANRDRPDPPTNLRIDQYNIQPRAITIIWSAGNFNYGPIRNFTVQYRKKDEYWQSVNETIKPQTTSYTVKGLQPNSIYRFQVAASNDIGSSRYSQESPEATTAQDKPDGAPQNVKIVPLTQTSIKISWESPPPSTWNGLLLSDIIQYREEGATSFREEEIPYGKFSVIMERLTMGVKYEIQIATSNIAGRGPSSILQVFRVGDIAPFAAPLNVQMLNRSSTQVEITWQSPPLDSTNGQLIGYKVLYWLSAQGSCTENIPIQLTVTELRALISNLKPFSWYCSTVQAVNIVGEGPKSVPVLRRTSEDYPGPPVNLRFRNVTLTELNVLWDPPKTPNGEITFYTLQYYASYDDQKTEISTLKIAGSETQQYISGLIENLRYTFSLAANTSIGKGVATEVAVTTGPQPGSPEAPKKPEITLRSKVIYIIWQNNDHGKSPIVAYKIQCKEDGGPEKWNSLLDVNHPEPSAQLGLNDLKPSLGYSFRVRAINSEGISPPSPSSDLYTTPSSMMVKQASPFHTQWWFLVIVALAGIVMILLIITLLCFVERRRKKGRELKRSTTSTTVMSTTPEPEDGGFPSMELRQSRRSVNRNKTQNNTLTRSPPRPSPASVIYAEGIGPIAGASGISHRHPGSDDSSVLSEKPSNLGDSSDEMSSDSDDSSVDSIAKAPVPSSPPPPAFSSQYSRSTSNNTSSGAGAISIQLNNKPPQNPPWRFQNPPNAYTYTDSEADSSHYAFSLNNGNIVVNNVAGARSPLTGFSSFV